jgi:hypothetical protein
VRTVSEASRPDATAHHSLGDLARRFAYEQLPSRFHTLAQLGFPLAFQLWTWGWHRTAGWFTTLALFSLWALAEQHLTGRADSEIQEISGNRRQQTAWSLLRRVSAGAGTRRDSGRAAGRRT